MSPSLPHHPPASPFLISLPPLHPLLLPTNLIYRINHTPSTGGTNLRVCLVTLQGNGKFDVTQSKYRLTGEQKQSDGQKLFDFCAECLGTFVSTNFEEGSIKAGELLSLETTVRISGFVVLYCVDDVADGSPGSSNA